MRNSVVFILLCCILQFLSSCTHQEEEISQAGLFSKKPNLEATEDEIVMLTAGFVINHEECAACGICVEADPFEIISFNDDGKPVWTQTGTNKIYIGGQHYDFVMQLIQYFNDVCPGDNLFYAED